MDNPAKYLRLASLGLAFSLLVLIPLQSSAEGNTSTSSGNLQYSSRHKTTDVDNDGFSNGVEEYLGSDPLDPDSIPEPITELYEDFENGFPLLFNEPYLRSLPKLEPVAAPESWSIGSSDAFDGSSALVGELYPDIFQQSITFTAPFKDSVLSFHSSFIDGSMELAVTVNGESGDWRDRSGELKPNGYLSARIPEGIHTIRIWFTGLLRDPDMPLKVYIDNFAIEAEADKDGIPDKYDNCPTLDNHFQRDSDFDGIGDLCDANPEPDFFPKDRDSDGKFDPVDNCPKIRNPEQSDSDGDGFGDICDPEFTQPRDIDGDSIVDFMDNCAGFANADQADMDGDGIGDLCDNDIDGDGLKNKVEGSFTVLNADDPNDAYLDPDGDGVETRFEIYSDHSPTQFNQYDSIDLLDFYPVNEGRMSLMSRSPYDGKYYDRFEYALWKSEAHPDKTTIQWQYDQGSEKFEIKGDGLYQSFSSGLITTKIPEGGFLLLPKKMKLGEVVTSPMEGSSSHQYTVQMIAQKKMELDRKLVNTVTMRLSIKSSSDSSAVENDYVFAQGLGLVGYNNLEFISFNAGKVWRANGFDLPNDHLPEKDQEPQKDKMDDQSDQAGSLGWLFIVLLAVAGFGGRGRLKAR